MSRIFITADTHLGHEAIIKYCNRPFNSLKEMNETIIKRWNERVKKNDIVYFLGDFCFCNGKNGKEGDIYKSDYYREQLNGDIIFLRGNHDSNNSVKSAIEAMHVFFGKKDIWLTHRPYNFNKNFKYNLVGHVHEKWLYKKINGSILLNVGVDRHNFYPIKLLEALNFMEQIERGRVQ